MIDEIYLFQQNMLACLRMCIFFCTFAPQNSSTHTMMENFQSQERYLRLLSERFPNSDAVVTELINLHAILSLPKGTEHFVSDLHGASNAFIHMIKNASGVIRRKVDDIYGNTLTEKEKRALCALIYYPDERIRWVKTGDQPTRLLSEEGLPMDNPTIEDWYTRRMHQILNITRGVSVKYTRSKVRKMLPKNFAYIIEELLYESSLENDRSTRNVRASGAPIGIVAKRSFTHGNPECGGINCYRIIGPTGCGCRVGRRLQGTCKQHRKKRQFVH
jgi:hypothetical protein